MFDKFNININKNIEVIPFDTFTSVDEHDNIKYFNFVKFIKHLKAITKPPKSYKNISISTLKVLIMVINFV